MLYAFFCWMISDDVTDIESNTVWWTVTIIANGMLFTSDSPAASLDTDSSVDNTLLLYRRKVQQKYELAKMTIIKKILKCRWLALLLT